MNNNQCTPVCFADYPPLIGHFPPLLASDWLRVTHLAMVMMLSSVNRINIGHYSEPAPRSLLMLCSCKLLPIYVTCCAVAVVV